MCIYVYVKTCVCVCVCVCVRMYMYTHTQRTHTHKAGAGAPGGAAPTFSVDLASLGKGGGLTGEDDGKVFVPQVA
jgi:hypothetical protein